MNNKKKIIIVSTITIAVCLALITGSTFALFTAGENQNVAITAANMVVTATPVDGSDLDTKVDFTLGTELAGKLPIITQDDVSFDSATNEIKLNRMTPGDYVTFAIEVENKGNIAVDCAVNFTQKMLEATAEIPAEKANKLWNALKVDVTKDGTALFTDLAINSTTFASTSSEMVLAAGEKATYEITIKFPNSDFDGSIDNQYINTNCAFVFAMTAVQHNDAQ